MVKVLIVDDEKWVRKGILHKISHLPHTYTWIKEASDGLFALDIIEEEEPDIIITDIKMDDMDGISFIKEVRKRGLNIRFMIISGHAEFQYAEEALNMGVMGYLLKPIQDAQFYDTFQKLYDDVSKMTDFNNKKEQQQRRNKQIVEEQIVNASLLQKEPYTLHNISQEMLQDPFDSTALTQQLASFFSPQAHYALIILSIDRTNYTNTSFQYQDLDLIKFAIKNIAEGILDSKIYLMGNNFRDNNQVFIMLRLEPANVNTIDEFVFLLFTSITKVLKITVTIGVSLAMAEITEELYKQAKSALDLRFIKGSHNVFYAKDVQLASKLEVPQEQIRLLGKAIEIGDFVNVQFIVQELFSKRKLSQASLIDFHMIYVEIIRMLMKLCSRKQLEWGETLDFDFISMDVANCFDSTEEIVQYLMTTIVTLLKPEHALSMNCSAMIYDIRDYIKQNYSENITIKDLSRKFAMNPNYLSTLFKQELGITFVKELTRIRMEKAQELLLLTGMPVSEIAASVGYDDVQYFYRKFKKIYSITPVEYRKAGCEL